MTPNTTSYFYRAHCLWTAWRLEHHWKKLSRLQRKAHSRALTCSQELWAVQRKLGEETALVGYLTGKYRAMTLGAVHPEKLSIL